MKQIPIIFSSEMVRALLNGTKTQTRRIVKSKHVLYNLTVNNFVPSYYARNAEDWCPYGQPGDLLYVRETCCAHEQPNGLDGVLYKADAAFIEIEDTREAVDRWMDLRYYGNSQYREVPSIHMPKWCARIWLRVTDVSVERLQDISEADALAEGIDRSKCSGDWNCPPSEVFMELWTKINGKESTDANPFVWKITFEVVSTTGRAGISEKKSVTV